MGRFARPDILARAGVVVDDSQLVMSRCQTGEVSPCVCGATLAVFA